MKKRSILCICALLLAAACSKTNEAGGEITVISREDGSGTRGAFIELFGVQEKNADGKTIDHTTASADITNSTAVVITSVAQNKRAIGYISLGSLNNSVKALNIGNVAATEDNIKNGSYTAFRPFNIVLRENLTPAAEDFINFILSAEGQSVVEKAGYIPITDIKAGTAGRNKGRVVVAGSSSVTPVMEKLKEAWHKINPDAAIEIQQSDSSMGINNTISGICEIGMASRALKDSELAQGIKPLVIAFDGIALIVHKENPVENLGKEQIKAVYTGKITKWEELQTK